MAYQFNLVRDWATASLFERLYPEATEPSALLMKLLAFTFPGALERMDAEDIVVSAETTFYWLRKTAFDPVSHPRMCAVKNLVNQYNFVIGLESVAGRYATMSSHLAVKDPWVSLPRAIGKNRVQ
jgi:hypothetical protein